MMMGMMTQSNNVDDFGDGYITVMMMMMNPVMMTTIGM